LNEKDELLTYFLEQEGIQRQKSRIVPPRSRFDPPCLSFAQERFWFLDQFEPNRSVYNSCKVERLVGKLDFASLADSLKTVVRRHEVLRTTYPAVDGQPIQKISPTMTLLFPLENLRGVPANDRDSEVLRFAERESQCPFDLTKGPLIRAKVLQFSDEEHVLLLTLHQMIYDSWSVGVLFRELWTFYESFSRLRESSPGELPIQYADFAVWQREWLRGEVLESHIAYWKEQLGDSQPAADLPTDRSRPRLQSYHGRKRSIALPEPLKAALKDLSRREGATLFMALLAAFKTLLHRYTAQDDLVVGCPVINRSLPEIENLIGSFVNTLVLRTDVSGNPTFRAVLSRVRDVCLSAYAHQDLPFEKLVEELQPQRDLARSPLFQTMFAFQNTPLPNLSLPDLKSESIEVDGGIAKFDLTFSLAEKDQGIAGYVEYSTDLFDHATIGRMIGHFQTLLEGIVSDPDQRISDLPILSEAERNQLLLEWNDTKADYPKNRGIHKLFEEQAERTPDAIAVAFEAQQLTYRDLNTRANQLGHYLISLGVRPGKLVGICVGRSLEMVVGLLGILKAGGAYVPLDPSYPKERLAFMVEDAHLSVVVAQEKFLESDQLPTVSSQPLHVCLDRDWSLVRTQSPETPDSHWHSDSLAYVIYTSGSTGQPKGVQVSHRSVVNCLHSISRRLGFTGRDVLLAVTTISFDIAALELYLPLLVGGTVIVASREEAADGTALLRRLEECSATAMQATPSTWRLLLDAGWQGSEPFKIICGGDALSRDLANKLLARGTLWNLYGPTETTIWSAVRSVESGESSIPIGRPIANTRIYILDSRLKLVPIGVHGEIYVGGDGLALGYVNRPELNAEKFIPNPFSAEPGSRLYRTGDRARYLPDGNIEFLGRIDNQVKTRGYRIELGEIEAALCQHPAIKESVVVARDRDLSEDKDLIGYFVPKEPSAFDITELRNFLRQKLPDYMVPSLFVELEALPSTPNGKIDRNVLPPPDGERPRLDKGFVEPRTEVEEVVAQIWREVLKLDKIGIQDNFFDRGGHSLLATRVVARLRISFKIDIALRKLFELPTVAGLAEHIDHLRHHQFGTSIAPIVPVDRTQALPLSFSQRRLWYLHKVDANVSAYNIPAAFRVKGALDSAALEQALNKMVERHEVLRCYVKEVDGQPRQEILPSLRIALPVIDLTELPDGQAETGAKRLSSTDARQLHDLTNAPLMRVTLLKLAVDDHLFVLNFHHIIADGSSLAIFYKELAALYEALRDNKAVSLPRLPVQYADYAAWQHEWLKSSSFDTQVAYWKRQFVGLPEPCALPTDFDRPTVQTYRGGRLAVKLSEELTRSLKILSRQQSVTMFMTLFATFNILLSRIGGQEDIVIGSTIAGRNHPETDGLIGFFINTLPLRCNLAGDPNFVTLLQYVRELCLDAYANQDVPFEKIVEEINPRREPGRHPIFDILFNIADTSERILTLPGCEVTKLAQADTEAKFDIVLRAPEVGGKIELAIVYNTALFREGRITLLLEQWAALLDQVASHPELPISQLSLVTDGSGPVLPDPKEALDDSWGGAIHELVAEQARRSSESLAVVDENQSWTYDEMNQCANRLAHCLIDAGTRPKDLIGIYAHRSSSLIVALFGILKAGASFLILDPAYPAARTSDYLRIAQPKGWFQLEGSGELPDELLSCLDSLAMRCRMNVPQTKAEILQCLAAYANTDPATIVTADDPAYVAFTSGSTGEPKGVVCRHGPTTHFLPWQKDAFQLSEADRFAMLSGLAYSHLHRDVFTALSLGATLHIPNPSAARSPEYLIDWLERNAITVLHLTPALGQLLLTSSDARLLSVRRVFFGGDVLTPEMVASIRRLAPNATVGSFYGATETQRAVGYFEIANDSATAQFDGFKSIPLGRGIKDVQLLVLNRSQQLVGVGELGEVFVRSPHLAEGYIGDKERTERMFIVNPFTKDAHDRLYRTGEFGRYLPDGNVEWAGRNDRRVNIRGFRVELEEVESVLKQHPTVQNAAVILGEFELPKSETPLSEDSDNPKSKIENPKSDLRLVAYVAADGEPRSLADLLQSYLSTRLPHYMLPAHFVVLQSLPLSPNGKVDYRSLSATQFSAIVGTLISPRDEVENKLCEIFTELLGGSDVGIEENFFRIGGHSLLAARAAARIGDAFGVSLDLSTFLENPTVIGLAKKINSLRATGQTTTESDKDQREEFDL